MSEEMRAPDQGEATLENAVGTRVFEQLCEWLPRAQIAGERASMDTPDDYDDPSAFTLMVHWSGGRYEIRVNVDAVTKVD